jgi:hypothetical protein
LVLTRRCSGNRGESVTCPPVWRQPFVTGVGASGAIFGIYGAIGSWLMVRHRSIPAHAGAPLAGGLVAIVGYNLVFGFFQQNVDVAAHVGGLAAGFVAGSLLAASLTEATGWIGARAALVAIAGLVAIGALASRLPKVDGIRQVLTRLGDAERKANSEFERLAAELQQGQITPEAFARSVSDTVLPHWTAARDELARMRAGREQQTVTEIVSYMSMREDAIRLAAQAATSGDVSLMNAARQRRTEADALGLTLTSRAKGARPSNPTARAASLAGTVRDAAVPRGGARVSLRCASPSGRQVSRRYLQACGSGREMQTDATGTFAFSEVVPGPYVLRVALDGYAPEERQIDLRRGHAADGRSSSGDRSEGPDHSRAGARSPDTQPLQHGCLGRACRSDHRRPVLTHRQKGTVAALGTPPR